MKTTFKSKSGEMTIKLSWTEVRHLMSGMGTAFLIEQVKKTVELTDGKEKVALKVSK